MVKVVYPYQWKYMNKFTLLIYGMLFLGPMHWAFYYGHYGWKRGHVPRIRNMDTKYSKYLFDRGFRYKYLLNPAIE